MNVNDFCEVSFPALIQDSSFYEFNKNLYYSISLFTLLQFMFLNKVVEVYLKNIMLSMVYRVKFNKQIKHENYLMCFILFHHQQQMQNNKENCDHFSAKIIHFHCMKNLEQTVLPSSSSRKTFPSTTLKYIFFSSS